MRRIALIVVIAVILCPISMDAARRSKKTFPLMLGPKLSVGFFEGDESIYPVSFQGEAMLNLSGGYTWQSQFTPWLRIGVVSGLPTILAFSNQPHSV